jgi:hypothetical protein
MSGMGERGRSEEREAGGRRAGVRPSARSAHRVRSSTSGGWSTRLALAVEVLANGKVGSGGDGDTERKGRPRCGAAQAGLLAGCGPLAGLLRVAMLWSSSVLLALSTDVDVDGSDEKVGEWCVDKLLSASSSDMLWWKIDARGLGRASSDAT